MATGPGSDERRQHERFRCSCQIACQLVAGGPGEQWWDGEALDLARGGLLVVCEHGFAVRDVVKVRLQLGEASTVFLLTARIVRADRLPDGKWRMGCQIAPNLRGSEIKQILNQAGGDMA